MKYLLTLSAVLLICLSSGTSFAQKKSAPQKSKINRTKQTRYWAGVLQKQGMTAYQYGTHLLKGESLSGELNEPETIFALRAGKKINLNKFVGKKVIITGKKVDGYPLELGPELIEVSAIELDKVVKINMN